METPKKKSMAFIITFIVVLILLIVGYFLFVNKGIFGTKGSVSSNKNFESLTETEEQKNLDKINSGSKSGSIADFIASLFRKDSNTNGNNGSNSNNSGSGSNNVNGSNSNNSGSGSNNNGSGNNFNPDSSNLDDFGNFNGNNYSNNNNYNNDSSIPNPGSYNNNNQTNYNNSNSNQTNDNNTDNNTDTDTTEIDACLIVDENPLTFTPEEKKRLDELLRQFYMISSTLRTDDDISTIYNDIDQQKVFISQIETLTNQCYAQIDQKGLMSAGFGWTRHGNPWYSESNMGTFPYTSENKGYFDINKLNSIGYSCKDVSGYYYGVIEKSVGGYRVGESCDRFNDFSGYGSCSGGSIDLKIRNGNHPLDAILQAGCKWKDGVNFQDTERLLNIW